MAAISCLLDDWKKKASTVADEWKDKWSKPPRTPLTEQQQRRRPSSPSLWRKEELARWNALDVAKATALPSPELWRDQERAHWHKEEQRPRRKERAHGREEEEPQRRTTKPSKPVHVQSGTHCLTIPNLATDAAARRLRRSLIAAGVRSEEDEEGAPKETGATANTEEVAGSMDAAGAIRVEPTADDLAAASSVVDDAQYCYVDGDEISAVEISAVEISAVEISAVEISAVEAPSIDLGHTARCRRRRQYVSSGATRATALAGTARSESAARASAAADLAVAVEAAARARAEARAAALEEALEQAKRHLSAAREESKELRAASTSASTSANVPPPSPPPPPPLPRQSHHQPTCHPNRRVSTRWDHGEWDHGEWGNGHPMVAKPLSPERRAERDTTTTRCAQHDTLHTTSTTTTLAAVRATRRDALEMTLERACSRDGRISRSSSRYPEVATATESEDGSEKQLVARTRGFNALTEALITYQQGREPGRQLTTPGTTPGHAPLQAAPSKEDKGGLSAVVAAWRQLPTASPHAREVPYFYAVLGCDVRATADELRRAYRRLALRWHPDKHAHDSACEAAVAHERFQELAAAWSVLSDDALRAAYDADCCCSDWDAQRV